MVKGSGRELWRARGEFCAVEGAGEEEMWRVVIAAGGGGGAESRVRPASRGRSSAKEGGATKEGVMAREKASQRGLLESCRRAGGKQQRDARSDVAALSIHSGANLHFLFLSRAQKALRDTLETQRTRRTRQTEACETLLELRSKPCTPARGRASEKGQRTRLAEGAQEESLPANIHQSQVLGTLRLANQAFDLLADADVLLPATVLVRRDLQSSQLGPNRFEVLASFVMQRVGSGL